VTNPCLALSCLIHTASWANAPRWGEGRFLPLQVGGASAIVVGAFCEHNDQVHSLVDLLAAKAGPVAETETSLDNKSAVAFEKHRIRLRMAAGAWRDYHGPIHARHPSPAPAPPTQLSKRTCRRRCGALTNAKSARRATSSSPSPSVRQGRGAGTATHDAGGLPQGSPYFLGQPWLRPRGPKDANGVAQQRRCPVKYKPPPPGRSCTCN
jgi:hypothetical protein